jgi:hypothetical protein
MAKKSRRVRRQQTARIVQAQSEAAGLQPPSEAEEAPAASAGRQKQVDFRTEYRYVISDLRSMAIIAVAMLGVLVGLSLIIR